MSYDYLLYRKPKFSFTRSLFSVFARNMGKLMAMAESLEGSPIGTLDEVKSQLSSAFPGLDWRKVTLPAGFRMPKSKVTDWSWCTRGAPEISLGADDQGCVRLVGMSRGDLRQIKAVARVLNLGIVDEQAFG